MSFYLYQMSYTTDAVKALVANPTDREAAAGFEVGQFGVWRTLWRHRRCGRRGDCSDGWHGAKARLRSVDAVDARCDGFRQPASGTLARVVQNEDVHVDAAPRRR